MPTVCQVSSIITSPVGTSTDTGPRMSPAALVSSALGIAQSSCRMPKAYGHRPDSAYPPGARTTLPGAANTEASLAPGLSPNTSSRGVPGNRAASRLEPLMLLTTHDVDGQKWASALVTSLRV